MTSYEEAVRALAAAGARRDERDSEFEASASPDVVREIQALYRAGASTRELREAFIALETREKRELSASVSPDERAELLAAAARMEAEDTPAARAAYRATYCRVRDDVKLRDKLSKVADEGLEAAWREADDLERRGLPPQDVAAELRRRIPEADLRAMDELVERPVLPAAQKEKKKTSTASPLERGFLENSGLGRRRRRRRRRDEKEVPPRGTEARAVAMLVASRLAVSEPAVAEAAVAEAVAAYARLRKAPHVADMSAIFEASAEAAARLEETDRAAGFVAGVVRRSLPEREGPALHAPVVDFMLEVHARRTAGEDDARLKRDVLAHLERHGPGFLEHMAACAALIEALQEHPILETKDHLIRSTLLDHYINNNNINNPH